FGDPCGEWHAAPLDTDQHQAVRSRLLLDDLVGEADRRPADLVRGHDLTAAHRSFPASRGHPGGLTGPWLKGSGKDTAPGRGQSVDRNGHPGGAGPPCAATDIKEV